MNVAFVDFRRNATENTVPSLLLMGRILGEEKRAAEFIDFYIAQMRKVTNVVDGIPAEDRPLVAIENLVPSLAYQRMNVCESSRI